MLVAGVEVEGTRAFATRSARLYARTVNSTDAAAFTQCHGDPQRQLVTSVSLAARGLRAPSTPPAQSHSSQKAKVLLMH